MSFARPSTFEAEPPARGEERVSDDGESLIAGILRVARERLATIVFVTFCVCAAAAAVAVMLPTKFTAASEVIFDPHKSNGVDPASNEPDLTVDPATIQNQIHILTSRDLAERVIQHLGLAQDAELASGGSGLFGARASSAAVPGTLHARVVDSFLRHLSVQTLGLSTTFSIAFTSDNPRMAAAVANALADAYIERQLETKSRAARIAAAWLTERVRQLAVDTQKAEAAVAEYKQAHGISEVMSGMSEQAVSTPLVDQQLVALQTQLVQARATLSEKSAVRAGLAALAADGGEADLSRFTDAPVIVALRQQESEALEKEADLRARYGPRHPKMIAAEADRKNIENKIAIEIARMMHSVDSDVAVAQTQVDALERNLRDIEHQAASENVARATLQSLEANAKSTRAAYETFVSRLRDVQGQEAMQVPDASIISRAPVPQSPNPPARSLIVAAAVPVGLILGLLVALLQERGASAPVPVPAFRPLPPVLVRLPHPQRQGLAEARIAESVVREPAAPYSAAVQALESLIPRNLPGQACSIGICAPDAGAGSATLALSLARVAARRGRRVIVVDADPVPRLGALVNAAADRPGLSDVVLRQAPLHAAILRDPVPGVFAMTGGRSSAMLDRLYGAPDMRALLQHLRSAADLVIVNLPPLSGLSPSVAAVSTPLDGLVMLVGWNGGAQASPRDVQAALAALGTPNAGLAVVE